MAAITPSSSSSMPGPYKPATVRSPRKRKASQLTYKKAIVQNCDTYQERMRLEMIQSEWVIAHNNTLQRKTNPIGTRTKAHLLDRRAALFRFPHTRTKKPYYIYICGAGAYSDNRERFILVKRSHLPQLKLNERAEEEEMDRRCAKGNSDPYEGRDDSEDEQLDGEDDVPAVLPPVQTVVNPSGPDQLVRVGLKSNGSTYCIVAGDRQELYSLQFRDYTNKDGSKGRIYDDGLIEGVKRDIDETMKSYEESNYTKTERAAYAYNQADEFEDKFEGRYVEPEYATGDDDEPVEWADETVEQ